MVDKQQWCVYIKIHGSEAPVSSDNMLIYYKPSRSMQTLKLGQVEWKYLEDKNYLAMFLKLYGKL